MEKHLLLLLGLISSDNGVEFLQGGFHQIKRYFADLILVQDLLLISRDVESRDSLRELTISSLHLLKILENCSKIFLAGLILSFLSVLILAAIFSTHLSEG